MKRQRKFWVQRKGEGNVNGIDSKDSSNGIRITERKAKSMKVKALSPRQSQQHRVIASNCMVKQRQLGKLKPRILDKMVIARMDNITITATITKETGKNTADFQAVTS